eukprot:CAMPEP_0168398780 /NCGR_PEP_ID=MMETSP0228-20121227/21755_1 /TAXON_ID=133427 /ORGANISM="Protoceratium reticulatum, Strain CCCM 535 (=CCMP 1889)" /LENGTH=249 /DNA_ID=CAMNT_0008412293 /DNA_START=137 /DNA_END=883 /DNA_ORIENTATION=+
MALHFERSAVTEKLVEARRRRGAATTILAVGANDMAMDIEEYKYMIKDPTAWRMIFVEPIPFMLEPLQERLASWGINKSQVTFINAAVCRDSAKRVELQMVPLWAINELDVGMITREITHLSSLDRATTLRGIWESGVFQRPLKEALARRVQGVPVRCLSPADLLSEAGLAPEALDVLFVDAEGLDLDIVRDFAALEGLRPSLVKFEWINAGSRWPEFMQLMNGCPRADTTSAKMALTSWALQPFSEGG